MSIIIDAIGLSCPEPLLKANPHLIEKKERELIIYVDNDASKENILRAGRKHGWHGEAMEVSAEMKKNNESLENAKYQLNLHLS